MSSLPPHGNQQPLPQQDTPGFNPYSAPSPEQASPYSNQQPKSSTATIALILSIVGLFFVGFIFGLIGSIIGWLEMKAVDKGTSNPRNRGLAKAAFIIGIAATILWIILVALWVWLVYAIVSDPEFITQTS